MGTSRARLQMTLIYDTCDSTVWPSLVNAISVHPQVTCCLAIESCSICPSTD